MLEPPNCRAHQSLHPTFLLTSKINVKRRSVCLCSKKDVWKIFMVLRLLITSCYLPTTSAQTHVQHVSTKMCTENGYIISIQCSCILCTYFLYYKFYFYIFHASFQLFTMSSGLSLSPSSSRRTFCIKEWKETEWRRKKSEWENKLHCTKHFNANGYVGVISCTREYNNAFKKIRKIVTFTGYSLSFISFHHHTSSISMPNTHTSICEMRGANKCIEKSQCLYTRDNVYEYTIFRYLLFSLLPLYYLRCVRTHHRALYNNHTCVKLFE